MTPRVSRSSPAAAHTSRADATFAILPVKRFSRAKERLETDISPGLRRALAEAMVIDVLMALRRTTGIDGVLMVTGEPVAEAIGRGYGARVIRDDEDSGQSAAAQVGVGHAIDAGAARALLVPGDCPALDPAELEALLSRPLEELPPVVIVADRHGTGTNGLLLAPPGAIAPAFGPGSRARHQAAAAAAGVACEVVQVPSLALDVDTAEDLAVLREELAGRRGGAAHTRGMLSRLTWSTGGPTEPAR